MTMNKINNLIDKARDEDSIKIGEHLQSFIKYTQARLERNIQGSVSEAELEEAYQTSLNSINEINRIGEEYGEKIIEIDTNNREIVENFNLTIVKEVFANRFMIRK